MHDMEQRSSRGYYSEVDVMKQTVEQLREKKVREVNTKIRMHVQEIVNDFMEDVDDGLRVQPEQVLEAHTVEVKVKDADGNVVWGRSNFLQVKRGF